MKTCSKCHKEKPLTEFHRHRAYPDGYRGQCKACTKRYPEYNKANAKKWYEDHKEQAIARGKAYQKSHPEVRHKAYRNYVAKPENKAKLSIKGRAWKQANHGKVLEYTRKRRNIKRGTEGTHTQGEWELLKIQYGFTCPACSKKEPAVKLTADHIIPLSKGGSDFIENIQPLCEHCNFSKQTKIAKYAFQLKLCV